MAEAQKGVQLDRETFTCSICVDLLKDPVTVSCGHSYCMSCITTHWDKEDERSVYSCPQCRQTFTPRPVLLKNTILAVLVEKMKKSGLHSAPDHRHSGHEDVVCDVCTGSKQKACKSCLFCLISFCETHLQPHYEIPAYAKHKLVEPSKKLQENICSRHDEVMKMFCRTDQQCICYLCSVDEHKGHDTVSATAERTERQKELEVNRQSIQQRIQNKERDVKQLQQEVEAINHSADRAVEQGERIFTEIMSLMERRRSDVKQQVRSQQEAEVNRVKELQEKLEQEIMELKRKDAELKKLSFTEDHIQFLQDYPLLSQISDSTGSSSMNIHPLKYFEDVTAAVSKVRDKLQDALSEKWTNVSSTVTDVEVLPSQTEPKTRAYFLKYSRDITLDRSIRHQQLLISKRNRKATYMKDPKQPGLYGINNSHQVLGEESLTGRCYWEVEWRGEGVSVAVADKDFIRDRMFGSTGFGHDDKSWALDCDHFGYGFWHNNIHTLVPGPRSSRVGVFLDHSEGILSFYSISDSMTLLHTVQTAFTQPLCAGLGFECSSGDSAEFCRLK
ncbi:tripartite motif-containing protein 16-like [Cheilinus undulatus]|uniref:tripartite motif-containing protein 16-like n=1 Tax=Cheilinus undulatus TaxID=241271 RepID=UPI001BD6DD22|nr:tripartite motif-containing protein 16-like [Cheilinus undulatus]